MPETTVLIPVYNCAKYIVTALESVLAQKYTDYELLIIDDGSTDDGSTDDGSTDDGSTDDGSTDDGSTDDTEENHLIS